MPGLKWLSEHSSVHPGVGGHLSISLTELRAASSLTAFAKEWRVEVTGTVCRFQTEALRASTQVP